MDTLNAGQDSFTACLPAAQAFGLQVFLSLPASCAGLLHAAAPRAIVSAAQHVLVVFCRSIEEALRHCKSFLHRLMRWAHLLKLDNTFLEKLANPGRRVACLTVLKSGGGLLPD